MLLGLETLGFGVSLFISPGIASSGDIVHNEIFFESLNVDRIVAIIIGVLIAVLGALIVKCSYNRSRN
jgi:hypothetical protein